MGKVEVVDTRQVSHSQVLLVELVELDALC
jgi:hypothetical protein